VLPDFPVTAGSSDFSLEMAVRFMPDGHFHCAPAARLPRKAGRARQGAKGGYFFFTG